MQDRFKFRAWNKFEKRYMTDLTLFGFGTNGQQEIEECQDDGKFFPVYELECCVLEQCTGLKDKNGKLIYEGDIVKSFRYCAIEDKKFPNKPLGRFPVTGIIKWDSKLACFENDEIFFLIPKEERNQYISGVFILSNEKNIELEIVGNIHENPELLEG